MIKKIILTEEIVKDLIQIYKYAESYVGAANNIVQPIWERINKQVVEEQETVKNES